MTPYYSNEHRVIRPASSSVASWGMSVNRLPPCIWVGYFEIAKVDGKLPGFLY